MAKAKKKLFQNFFTYSKYLTLGRNLAAVFGFSFTILGFSPLVDEVYPSGFAFVSTPAKASVADEPSQFSNPGSLPELLISGENSLLSQASPNNPEPEVARRIGAVITAYSSTVWQTDDTPFITAAGTDVRDGIIANNYLPFGSKVRIPEIYGSKVFVVEDRMSWQKGNYHFDIWFSDYWDALNFGAKRAYIEVLGS